MATSTVPRRGAPRPAQGLIRGDDTFTCRAATDTALEEVEVAGRCSVAKLWRGGDVARRLVEAVFAFADRFGPASVYWLTQEYNGPARSLSLRRGQVELGKPANTAISASATTPSPIGPRSSSSGLSWA